MQTIWPAYDGSVRTSWYPVIAVLKTTSPTPTPSAPSDSPTKARPSSSTSAAKGLSRNNYCLVDAVLLVDEDLDALCVRGGHVLADVVRPDRQLAMPAVDEDRQLDRARSPEIHQPVQGRALRAPVVAHV